MSVFCSHTLVVGSPPATQMSCACLTMDDGRSDEECRYESDGRRYEWTSNTFTKRELPHDQRPTDYEIGQSVTLPSLRESMFHEAKVYQLLATYTDIPVPKNIVYGSDDAGLAFIQVEKMEGTVRGSDALKRCWMPRRHRSPDADASGPCERCAAAVRRSADDFVHCTVLPELRRLRSRVTGLDGFVVPPRWVRTADKRGRWEAKTSEEDEFVFVLHDLVLDHMLLSTQTLQVAVFVDVEESGYCPGEMQQWKFDRAAQESLSRDEALVRSHISLLS
jgi:hypothetical protein